MRYTRKENETQARAHLRTIRAAGLSLYVAVDCAEEARIVTGELGPDGLYIRFRDMFPSPEEFASCQAMLTA